MPSFDILIAFATATAIFAYMPGPALLYTAAQTIARGRSAGFFAAFGIHIGCYVHVIAAALGLSAVFELVPAAYTAVKIAGAIYLIWLGISIIRSGKSDQDLPEVSKKTNIRAFFESATVEILNPKVAIFFIAFLPQFVDPAAALPLWAQFLILGTIVNLSFSSADIICVLLASKVMKLVGQSNKVERTSRWLGGSLLIVLGAKLALFQR